MIDIEKLADGIKPKSSTVFVPNPGNPITASGKEFLPTEYPLSKEIFTARDIKDLQKRKEYLTQLIEEEKVYETKEVYRKPTFKGFTINNKFTPIPQDDIKVNPDRQLIKHCEDELLIIEDLLLLEKIVQEYSAIQGINERVHYLFYAKQAHTNLEYRRPNYYNELEFSQIVEAITNAINKEETTAINQENSVKRLPWKADKKDLSELIKALSLTALAGIPETDIIKLFESIFIDEKGNPIEIRRRHEINKNELQDKKFHELFTYKMNKAIDEFYKKKHSPDK